MSDRIYDVIVFGATGYTGALVVKYLAERALHNNESFTWAIAGRSKQKLEQIKAQAVEKNPECKDLQIVIADVTDQKSIDAMVAQTRVLLTTAGPYNLYGRPVVEACVRIGTSYVDLTGEVNFAKAVMEEFHTQAQQKGVFIVSSCGYDSIPSDLGTMMLIEEAKKQGKTVKEAYGVFQSNGKASGGTIASAFEMFSVPPEVRKAAAHPFSLNPADKKPAVTKADLDQKLPEYHEDVKRWTIPSPLGPGNSRVVRRSAALLDYAPEFHYREGMVSGHGFARAFLTWFTLALGFLMMSFPFTRNFLRNFLPKQGEGPNEHQLKTGYFRQQTFGHCTDGSTIVTEVAGGEPGYLETSKMISEAALCLAKAKLPSKGGVLTPAASMGVELIRRLEAAGLKFRIVN